jgi:hypothetical protein
MVHRLGKQTPAGEHTMNHQFEPTELAHTSMCVWEHIQSTSDNGSKLSSYIEQLQSTIGVVETRYAMVEFAKHIEILYSEVSNFYHEPFDFEFVPACIEKAYELFGHLGALPAETIRDEDMRVVWVLMQSYGASVSDLLNPLAEYSFRHCMEVRGEDGEAFITDYVPDDQLQLLGDPFFSVSRTTPGQLPVVISDLDTQEQAQSLIEAIRDLPKMSAAA